MFMQASYDGSNEILLKMANFNFSQDAFDIVKRMGANRFIQLAKTGKLKGKLAALYAGWIMDCPQRIKERILEDIVNAYNNEADVWLNICAFDIRVNELICYIELAPKWFDQASMMIRFIIEKAMADHDVIDADMLVVDVINNYIDEAIEVAKYAELL